MHVFLNETSLVQTLSKTIFPAQLRWGRQRCRTPWSGCPSASCRQPPTIRRRRIPHPGGLRQAGDVSGPSSATVCAPAWIPWTATTWRTSICSDNIHQYYNVELPTTMSFLHHNPTNLRLILRFTALLTAIADAFPSYNLNDWLIEWGLTSH